MVSSNLADPAENAAVKGRRTLFRPVAMSLEGLLGTAYAETVAVARAYLSGEERQSLRALAAEPVDFFPAAIQSRLVELLAHVGQSCVAPLADTPPGATTDAFRSHAKLSLAPSSGLGFYRCTEAGRLFLIAKSAHYHAALGHAAVIDKVEGRRHMAGIYFHQLDTAEGFVAGLNQAGIDISAQTYKEGCPPSALTKLPLVAGFEVVDWLLAKMDAVLGNMLRGKA